MAILKLITLLIGLQSQNIRAFELPKKCTENEAVDCVKCKTELSPVLDESFLNQFNKQILGPVDDLTFYKNKASNLRKMNTLLKGKLASMFRTLRDGKGEPTHIQGYSEIERVRGDFNRLTILTKESLILKAKHNVCMFNCSAQGKLELLNDLAKIQKLKTILILNNPILANSNFEKLLIDMPAKIVESDEMFDDKIFNSTLQTALLVNLNSILKNEDEYYSLFDENNTPVLNLKNPEDLKTINKKLIAKYPLISEAIVLDVSEKDLASNSLSSACRLSRVYKDLLSKKENQEMAIDVALFTIPFALGPIGRLSGTAFELTILPRLASYGLKATETDKMLNLGVLTLQGSIIGRDLSSFAEHVSKCNNEEVKFISNATKDKLNNLEECKDNLTQRIFLTELSLVPMGLTSIAPHTITLLKSGFNPKNIQNEAGIIKKTSASEILSAIGLKEPKITKPLSERVGLLFKDFGGGKNKVIKKEIDDILNVVREEKNHNSGLSNIPKDKTSDLNKFFKQAPPPSPAKLTPVHISADHLSEYEKLIGKDTIELLFIPGADVPHLPQAIKRIGHIAFRIGDKVYHQTGGSGFRIESFANFLNSTKKDYKVYGEVLKASEKEQKVMASYFQKVYDKKIPYSFLANNCSQTICRAMGLADIEKMNPVVSLDPLLTKLVVQRNDRVILRTVYNVEKDLNEKELLKANLANRAAFYGVPLAGAGLVGASSYRAIDSVIEYLEQIKDSK